ncbi:serine/threonine-protein kinase [Phytohabitans rumicis]|uniref:Protein kinase domain-containing protein n=1 Tax=Phytohabitans rumicis TaxID=1076125 RepID=A0A6V8L6Z2_9ACTN|nr:serine/threonine-protein kinase [Phytohabitans rumicis]GFJ93023.1 hypothetical protein Prum_066650 [Phytohabitans rumicis]
MDSRAAPLYAGDPRRLGRYELEGRLGEGGMGTVYLARDPDGRQVAVKVIRGELARDDQFRRRFRSEVNRARQVPPFCTAEVLDADPDNEQPYLVVEYVDGPSLSAVVAERGPLTPANLHGLAIGVATALTAIHGAGVIHRDLKPSNVLLAPGSPKVIDFGIAQAMEATSEHTGPDQMVGTVGYMAPERFGPGAGDLTAAADVFAWGAVVAYAGTGRSPFAADSPPAQAARILTQPPDLGVLAPPLRGLVERALAKDPAARPTSRDLLDLLLSTDPLRSPALAAALAEQPALLVAAEEAQAATDQQPAAQLTAAAVPDELATVAAGPTEIVRPAVQPKPAPPAPRRSWGRIANGALAATALATSLAVLGVVTGVLPLAGDASPSTTPSAPPSSPPTSAPLATGSPRATQLIAQDPLTAPKLWLNRDDPAQLTTCLFDDALVVTRGKLGPYRCPGPMDQLTDFTVAVDVRLGTPGSCGALWLRFAPNAGHLSGYLVRICPEGLHVATHGVGDGITVTPLRTLPFASPIPPDTTVRISATVQGSTIALERDGQPVGMVQDSTFKAGRMQLGIYADTQDHEPPFTVAYTNVEVRAFSNG